MSLIDNFFEKFANDEFDVEEERELIKRFQEGDPIAYKKLRKKFKGVIQDSINKANVSTDNISDKAIMNAAMKRFRTSLESYDPSVGVKPSTWITSNITRDLKNVDREYKNETRLSDSDTILLGNIETAMNQLSVEDDIDDPTPEDIQRKIKDNFSKTVDIDDIENIRKRKRNEFSANRVIGEDDEGESISFGDISSKDEKTVDDYMQQKKDEEKLNELLSKLEEPDRKLYKEYKGLGEYKNQKPKKLLDLAKEHNFDSEYFVSKKLTDIEKKMKEYLDNGNSKDK